MLSTVQITAADRARERLDLQLEVDRFREAVLSHRRRAVDPGLSAESRAQAQALVERGLTTLNRLRKFAVQEEHPIQGQPIEGEEAPTPASAPPPVSNPTTPPPSARVFTPPPSQQAPVNNFTPRSIHTPAYTQTTSTGYAQAQQVSAQGTPAAISSTGVYTRDLPYSGGLSAAMTDVANREATKSIRPCAHDPGALHTVNRVGWLGFAVGVEAAANYFSRLIQAGHTPFELDAPIRWVGRLLFKGDTP